MVRIQKSGEAFLTNAVIGGKFLLRACIVNFPTSLVDVNALPGLVARLGRLSWIGLMRPQALSAKMR